MITLDDIRRYATAFPEVEEGTHFRLPNFKVKEKPFAGLEKGDTGHYHVREHDWRTS